MKNYDKLCYCTEDVVKMFNKNFKCAVEHNGSVATNIDVCVAFLSFFLCT